MKSLIIKLHNFFIEVSVIIVTSYFVIRKTTDISLSKNINNIFQPPIAGIIIDSLVLLVGYALIAKVVIFSYRYFKKIPVPSLHPPHYRCLLNNNKEIEKHIAELAKQNLKLENIQEKHSYETNILLIHSNLCEHIINSLKEFKISHHDVFISLFHDEKFDLDFKNINEFQYCSHYDQTYHSTSTSTINIKSHKKFAGCRAIVSKKIIYCARINKKNYDKGDEERRKTIKHYLGIPLKIGNNVVALLNIEFHNISIFKGKKDLVNFYKNEIQAFVYLFEYQIHKKYFFTHLHDKVIK